MATAHTHLLRIRNAAQIVRVSSNQQKFKIGAHMNENAGMVVNHEGLIEAIGIESSIQEKYGAATFVTQIDATGLSIVPGFVDGHTHPVWSGDRVHEFAMKLAGATYMDIHKAGGGIGFTVNHTRASSEEELTQLLLARLKRMLAQGTTVTEGKSGYGLESATEMKMLKVLHRANQQQPVEIVATYLGGHSVPKGSTAAAATEDIINNQLPALKELKDKGEISPTFIDVFYEKGVFEGDDTIRILEEGKKHGLAANFHGDELNPMRAAHLAHKVKAHAISHLEHVDEEGMKLMAQDNIFAVLLPTTAYVLRIPPPPARALIDAGVPVALGSDFNPNAHCMSMPMVMNLACVLMKMTMPEALVAATLNSAGSLKCSDRCGSLEVGKFGDMVIINAPKWEHVVYEMADPPILHVVKKGKVVYSQK